jgi:hypothetical protein
MRYSLFRTSRPVTDRDVAPNLGSFRLGHSPATVPSDAGRLRGVGRPYRGESSSGRLGGSGASRLLVRVDGFSVKSRTPECEVCDETQRVRQASRSELSGDWFSHRDGGRRPEEPRAGARPRSGRRPASRSDSQLRRVACVRSQSGQHAKRAAGGECSPAVPVCGQDQSGRRGQLHHCWFPSNRRIRAGDAAERH